MKVAQREESEGCPHGALVLAECQSHGVGRGGRDWVSQPNVSPWPVLTLNLTRVS